jgi:hypothetical protein
MNGARLLLEGLFDYAGLFPPAELSLEEAVERYAAYRQGGDAWMLGRFVVPVASLEALEAASAALPADAFGSAWPLSVLGSGGMEEDRQAIAEFATRQRGGRLRVDTVELKVTSGLDVRRARALARDGWDVYCEISGRDGSPAFTPPDTDALRRDKPSPPQADSSPIDTVLDAIAVSGLHVKVRAGGVTSDAIPPARYLARVLAGCVQRGLSIKATAGLHHAVSGEYPLTYEADAGCAGMHGYLNLVIAAGVAQSAGPAAVRAPEVVDALARILSLRSTPIFTPGGVLEWLDEDGPLTEGPLLALSPAARALLRSIGTCSFEEPVADAHGLGLT